MHAHARTPRRYLKLLALMICGLIGGWGTQPAAAWKPAMHVFIAEQAMQDAVDDGKVTIYATDYITGQIQMDQFGKPVKIGEYAVNPQLLDALRKYPAQYRAGVFGPDAYPDIVTGQQMIHPAGKVTPGETDVDINAGGPGTNSWLEHIWNSAYNNPQNPGDMTPQAKAFAAGYLSHAAGDMYAHTFINYYTGGAFHFVENGVKHVVLEGYIGKRLPALPSWDASIDGLQDWIYRNMVYASPGSDLETKLLVGDMKGHSIPAIFSKMKNELQADIDTYDAKRARFEDRYRQKRAAADAKGQAASDCGLLDFSCSATVLRAEQGVLLLQAAAIQAEKVGWIALNAPKNEYRIAWRNDITDGLKLWPNVSEQVAKALFFTPPKPGESFGHTDAEKAKAVLEDYAFNHIASMAGLPDFVGAGIFVIKNIIDDITEALRIPFIADIIKEIKEDLVNFMLKNTVGVTLDELKDELENPETRFDPVLNNSDYEDGGHLISLKDFNHNELHIDDDGFSNPADPQRFDWTTFAPAYNSVTMMKLLMMDTSEVDHLMSDLLGRPLDLSERLQEPNVMLGFAETIDGSNQWVVNEKKMILARDCVAYRKVFMKQTGELSCGENPVTVTPASARVWSGQSVSFTVTSGGPVQWSLTKSIPGASLNGSTTNTVQFVAPAKIATSDLAVLKVVSTEDPNRYTTVAVLLMGLSEKMPADEDHGQSFFWSGQGDGQTWKDPCNWYPAGLCGDRYPGQSADKDDSATIDLEGARSGVVAGIGAKVSLRALTLNKGMSLYGGEFTVKEVVHWNGGNLGSILNVPQGARLLIEGDGVTQFQRHDNDTQAIVNNAGTAVLTSPGMNFSFKPTFNNSGIFRVQGNASFTAPVCCVDPAQFVNTGQFIVDGAGLDGSSDTSSGQKVPATVNIAGFSFMNSGTVTVNGALELGVGLHEFRDGSKVEGNGALRLKKNGSSSGMKFLGMVELGEGVTLELGEGSSFVAGTFDAQKKTFTDPATLSGGGSFNWTGGIVSGRLNIGPSMEVNIGGTATKTLDGGYNGGLTNAGVMTLTDKGDLNFYQAPYLKNDNVFNIPTTVAFNGNSCCVEPTSKLINTGILNVAPANGAANGKVTLKNVSLVTGGTMNLQNSDLELGYGNHSLGNGAKLTGSGTLRLKGANAGPKMTGELILGKGDTFEIAQGSYLGGDGSLSGEGAFLWSGGALYGKLALGNGIVSTLAGTEQKYFYGSLTNGGSMKVSAGSQIYYSQKGEIINSGTMETEGAKFFSGCCVDPNRFTNTGTLLQKGGTTEFSGVYVTNTGKVQINGGGIKLSAGESNKNTYRQTAGETILNGGTLATNAIVGIEGGTLSGAGIITGNVFNGGQIRPGNGPGSLTLTGNFTQAATGALQMEIGGKTPAHDQLIVNGNADVKGTLAVSLVNGYVPTVGDRYPIFAYNAQTGGFNSLTGLNIGNGLTFGPEVGAKGTTLVVKTGTPQPTPGDLNGDGKVTVSDAVSVLAAAVGNAVLTPEQIAVGDVAPVPGTDGRPVGDGKITVADAIRLLRMSIGLE